MPPLNAVTNQERTLYDALRHDLADAVEIRIMVSFVMEKGVKLVLDDLRHAAERGVNIQLLTSTYMGITEPSALLILRSALGDKLDLRVYKPTDRSFHVKAYLIRTKTDNVVYVGSSNISREALTRGVEWNFRLQQSLSPHDFEHFSTTFDEFFCHRSEKVTDAWIKQYAESWRRVKVIDFDPVEVEACPERIVARGFQIEALYALEQARADGVKKALVVAATGTGKTYLAAFDSHRPEYRRVLFMAHRDEILQQTEESFRKVRPDATYGRLGGGRQETQVQVLLANVQTLSQQRYLSPEEFAPDSFDYIVVDEFHHAAASSYRRVLDYFRPKFLLGLTATPYRSDNQDLFALCDGNVAYEIFLVDAINRGLLVPFRYYGFYDETDYGQVEYKNGRYDTAQLEKALVRKQRASLVLAKYKQFETKRALGFCASIGHAEFMAEYFAKNGVSTAVCHSGSAGNAFFLPREAALAKLGTGEIKVLFSVDLFNEGVDMPSLDMVLFLRPTESFVVFLQQLGRGLRKDGQKKYLDVLDFIGNYKRAHYLPLILSGQNPWAAKDRSTVSLHNIGYPDDCQVNFDFRLIDLFLEMRRQEPLKQRMQDEYWRLKAQLGRRPLRTEMYNGVDIPLELYLRPNGWIGFLSLLDELTAEEIGWIDTSAEKFLREIERTAMSKSYKMPTIGAFLKAGGMVADVGLAEMVKSWRSYYAEPVRAKDMERDANSRNWRMWDDARLYRLAEENPIHFLSQGNRFFEYDQINKRFRIGEEVQSYLTPALADHVADILAWRTESYFARRYRMKGDD
jgi:superfamily II DNA or RNA helicase/HKD family nuclease